MFREQGGLTLKEELPKELLDCGACRVVAVAGRQIAYVYLNDPSLEGTVCALLEAQQGVAEV